MAHSPNLALSQSVVHALFLALPGTLALSLTLAHSIHMALPLGLVHSLELELAYLMVPRLILTPIALALSR